jgi:hypothetical protein
VPVPVVVPGVMVCAGDDVVLAVVLVGPGETVALLIDVFIAAI